MNEKEFVAILRAAVEGYLTAVDRWESAYQKYYRLPGYAAKSDDLAPEQCEYVECRRELERVLPRARRLCLKYQVRDSFTTLLRVTLGQHAPQQRLDSAIGRSERNAAIEALLELTEACQNWEQVPEGSDTGRDEVRKASLLQRVFGFFY